MQKSSGKILFSVDLEEFDIPEEYGQQLSLQTKLEVSLQGMKMLEQLMARHNVKATIFTTAFWAEHHAGYVKDLAEKHEIASHTYYHDRFEDDDLERSKAVLSAITGRDIVGLRTPQMQGVDVEKIAAAGYLYDSSLNPIWLPGRYNNLKEPRTLHRKNGVWILPASATPVARIPVFWLTFKNAPLHVYTRLCNSILKKDGYLVMYVHPWEFTDLKEYTLPKVVKRNDGESLLYKLDKLFSYFTDKGYSFDTHRHFVEGNIRSQHS